MRRMIQIAAGAVAVLLVVFGLVLALAKVAHYESALLTKSAESTELRFSSAKELRSVVAASSGRNITVVVDGISYTVSYIASDLDTLSLSLSSDAELPLAGIIENVHVKGEDVALGKALWGL